MHRQVMKGENEEQEKTLKRTWVGIYSTPHVPWLLALVVSGPLPVRSVIMTSYPYHTLVKGGVVGA